MRCHFVLVDGVTQICGPEFYSYNFAAARTREVFFHSRSHSHTLMNNIISNLRKKHTVPYLELAII